MTDAEITLLRFVEDVTEQNKSPVFFVLSQIDNQADWKRVQAKNNQFLRECFTKDGKANKGLIGRGFIPLSAGAEAKAKGLFEKGKIKKAGRDRAIDKSGMLSFRQILLEHLTNHSGPAHLREIVVQMHGILKSVRTHIANRMQAETVPLQDAEKNIRESKELVKSLTDKNRDLLNDMEQLGKETMLAGFRSTDSDDLLTLLRKDVEPLVKKVDVTKESERDKIQQKIKKIRNQWLQRPKDGFIDTWNQAWNDYQKQTIILLHERISEAANEASISYPIILREDQFPTIEGGELNPKDTLEFVKMAWQVSAGLTTVGGGVLVSTVVIGGTAVALGPIGLFLVAAGFMGGVWSIIKKRSKLKKLQKLFINYLPEYSDQIVTRLENQAQEDLKKHRGGIINIVRELIAIQQDRITTLENRLKIGDLSKHKERIGLLQKLENESKGVEQEIKDFYSNLTPTM